MATVGTPVEPGQFFLEEGRIAQRGGHQQEARLRQRQQRHLPGHAALAVGVVMELVHDDLLHVGLRPFAQRDIGQDLSSAAQDRGIAVHRGITGAQANVVGAELAAQAEPLLVDERLDRAGIDRALPLCNRLEMPCRGNQRFARTGGRVQDDILLLEQLQDGRLLRGIEPQALALGIFKKAPQQHIIAGAIIPGDQIVERH